MDWLPIAAAAAAALLLARLLQACLGLRSRAGRGRGQTARRRDPAERHRDRFDADELAARMALPLDALRRVRPGYRRIAIPKKRGGVRVLHAPHDDLKEAQRRCACRASGGGGCGRWSTGCGPAGPRR